MSRTKALVIFLLLLISLAFVNSAMAEKDQAQPDGGEEVRRDYHSETGRLSFIGASPGSPIDVPGAMVRGLNPRSRLNEILAVYGPEFGLSNASQQLEIRGVQSQDNGRSSARYQQIHRGVPILAGEIIVNQDSRDRLLSMSGEISPDLSMSVKPALPTHKASDLAIGVISKQYGLEPSDLSASDPELWIFDERLLRPSARPVELVWRTEVSGIDRLDIRELVLINAQTGGISLHFNQIDRFRRTIDMDQTRLHALATPESCPPIVVINSQLDASESEDHIEARLWVDGDYAAWPANPQSAGYVTLNLAEYTWIWDTQVWVRSTSSQPIEIGDIFNPAELGSVFVDELNTHGWAALSFSITLEDLCGQSVTQSSNVQPTPTQPTPTSTSAPTATPTATATLAPSIQTYSSNNGTTLPGSFLCDQSQPNCTSGSDLHADAAHAYAIDSYNFYLSRHGRYSLDSAGMTIISSVHYDSGYSNAFWDGSQVVYGDAVGYPLADDVVAHELTHGVTDYTSNLFYYYQSGAINESFSDLWGEFIDQTNGAGDDSAGVKWLMGEDVSGWGAARNMKDPPSPPNPCGSAPCNPRQPDRMTSGHYYTGSADLGWFGDNGGVHTNSGVNNKAVYLMTDGGSFNGYSVTALGRDKVSAIYYEVQTTLLTSGADYGDLYNALYQGCLNLIPGPQGISTVDCQQVRDATEAVEMNLEPGLGYNPDVEICQGGGNTIDLFFDDLESGGGSWGTGVVSGSSAWVIGSFYASSPVSSIWGDDSYSSSDSFVTMISDVALPVGSQPYLHFNHAFGFEDPDYDGGWLEYSINGGSTWVDAAPLLDDGLGYTGSINTVIGNGDNVHTSRSAFVGDSHGYVSNRYDLSSLGAANVRFRWRISTDSVGYDWGWFVDDIRIYTCGSPAPTPVFEDVPDDYWARDYIEILYDEGYIAGCQSSPPMYCPHRVLNRAESAVFVMRGAYGAIPDPPYPPPSTPSFNDVDPAYWGYGWIESMWTDGFTAGCGTDPLIYCPLRDHTRAEGSVFFMRIKNGVAYTPPPPVGIFADVSIGAWYDGWVEAAYSERLLPPCQTNPLKFCPEDTLDRSWAAYMMVWAKGGFGLPTPTLVPTSTSTPDPP